MYIRYSWVGLLITLAFVVALWQMPPQDAARLTQALFQPFGFYGLESNEVWWMEHQKWLEEKGYMLRPRYRPEWVPSWEKKGKKKPGNAEDRRVFGQRANIMDATRMSDNALVSMKRVPDDYENEIATYFSTEPLASHPHNHCVPIYEVLHIPDLEGEIIIIMPLLRPFYDPRFKSVGEAVEFFRQIFEGLQFMHQCNVAHRDCTLLNIMMDPKPTFPEMFHPGNLSKSRDYKSSAKFHSRTARPTKYLFIDFGLSVKFEPGQDHKALPLHGGDKSAPEFIRISRKDEYDPFPVDVYYLGNLIREEFLHKTKGLEFIIPLVVDMVQDEPTKRPTMDQVVSRYDKMMHSLSYFHLRSRLVERNEGPWFLFPTFRNIAHIYRTTIHVLTFRSPIPRPSS